MTASISSAVIGLFRFSASSSFSFGRLYFYRNVSISPRFSNFLAHSFVVISYNPLYFRGISCNICSFISDCVYMDPLSIFSLVSLLKSFLISVIFSKNELLDSLNLRIVLLFSMLYNSALILVISFLLLALGCLCCCSSSSCRRRVRLFV